MSDTITHDLPHHLAETRAMFPTATEAEVRSWAVARMDAEKLRAAIPSLPPCPAWCTETANVGVGHGEWEMDVPGSRADGVEFARYHRADFGGGVGIYQAEYCTADGVITHDSPVLEVDEAENLSAADARAMSSALLRAAHKLDQIR